MNKYLILMFRCDDGRHLVVDPEQRRVDKCPKCRVNARRRAKRAEERARQEALAQMSMKDYERHML